MINNETKQSTIEKIYYIAVQHINEEDSQEQFDLGQLCVDQLSSQYDYKAAAHFKKAYEDQNFKNRSLAAYKLGVLFESKNIRDSQKESIENAILWYEKAAQTKHCGAYYRLGKLFYDRYDRTETGSDYFKNAIQNNQQNNSVKLLPSEHQESLCYMGKYYANQQIDLKKAENYFQQAIDLGSNQARRDLVKFCLIPQGRKEEALNVHNDLLRDIREEEKQSSKHDNDQQHDHACLKEPNEKKQNINHSTSDCYNHARILDIVGAKENNASVFQLYKIAANEEHDVRAQNRLGELAIEKYHHYSSNQESSEQNSKSLTDVRDRLVEAVQKNHLKSKATLAYLYYENIVSHQESNQQLAYQYCNEILKEEKSSDERALSLASLILGKINLYDVKGEKGIQTAKYYFKQAQIYHESRETCGDTSWDRFLSSQISWYLFSCDCLPLRCDQTIKNIPNSMLINLQQAACYNNIQAITLLAGYYNANEYKAQEYKCYHQLKKYGVILDDASKNIIEQKQTFHSTRQYSQFFNTQSESIKVSYSTSINWTSSRYYSYSDDKSNPALRTGPPWRCM